MVDTPVHATTSTTLDNKLSAKRPREGADRLGTTLAYTLRLGRSMRRQGSQASSQLPFQQTRRAHERSGHILQTPVTGQSSVVWHCGSGFEGQANTHAPSTQARSLAPQSFVTVHFLATASQT